MTRHGEIPLLLSIEEIASVIIYLLCNNNYIKVSLFNHEQVEEPVGVVDGVSLQDWPFNQSVNSLSSTRQEYNIYRKGTTSAVATNIKEQKSKKSYLQEGKKERILSSSVEQKIKWQFF